MATDSFGREIGDVNKQDLMASLMGKVATVMETRDVRVEAAILRVESSIDRLALQIDKMLASDLKSAQTYAEKAITVDRESRTPKDDRRSFKQSGEIVAIRNAVTGIYNLGRTPHTFWVGISQFTPHALQQLADVLQSSQNAVSASRFAMPNSRRGMINTLTGWTTPSNQLPTSSTQPPSPQGPGGSQYSGFNYDDFGNLDKGFSKKWNQILNFIIASSKLIADTASNAFNIKPSNAYSGALNIANGFVEEQRELISQTEVYNKQLESQMFSWKQNYELFRLSGQYSEIVTKKWIENQRKGYDQMTMADKALHSEMKMRQGIEKADEYFSKRRANRIKHITATAMHSASQLGMDANATNDVFFRWHQQLGMSAVEIGTMASNMKDVANQTGITGENLQHAMTSAQEITKNLRNAGVLTATAAKNVVALTAEFEKLGVSDAGNRLEQALSSRSAFIDTDPRFRGYMERVARETGDRRVQTTMRSGTLLNDPEMTGKFFQGAEKQLKSMLTNYQSSIKEIYKGTGRTFDLASMRLEDMEEMFEILQESGEHGQHLYGLISASIQRQTTLSVGEITRVAKAGQTLKTSTERIAEMQEKLQSYGKGSEMRKELQQKIWQTQSSEAISNFAVVNKVMKNRGNMTKEQVQEAVEKRLTGSLGQEAAQKFSKDMSSSASDQLKVLNERAKSQGLNMDKIIKNLGGISRRQLQSGLASGDEQSNEILQQVVARIEQQEDVSKDPVKNIRDNVKKIHDALTSGLIASMNTLTGSMLRTGSAFLASLNPITAMVGLFNGATGLISGTLGFIGNTIQNAVGFLGKIYEYVPYLKTLAPIVDGINGMISIFSNIPSMLTNIVKSIGGAISSIPDLLVDAAKRIGDAAGVAIYRVVESVSNLFSKLKFWDQGTTQVTRDGLAYLHEGEAVIPKNLNKILAEGPTGFPSSNPILRKQSSTVEKTTPDSVDNKSYGIFHVLDNIIKSISKPSQFIFSSDRDLSDNNRFQNAFEGVAHSMMPFSNPINELITKPIMTDVTNVTNSSIRSIVDKGDIPRGFATASDALYQLVGGSTAANTPVSTQIIDATDDLPLRGTMTPNLMSYDNMETMVAKERYGDIPSPSTSSSGMDVVSDYLTITQAKLLGDIAQSLADIKSLLSGRSSNIVGAQVASTKSMLNPSIRAIGKDLVRGRWDLTYGDMSPGSITTEGRGGG